MNEFIPDFTQIEKTLKVHNRTSMALEECFGRRFKYCMLMPVSDWTIYGSGIHWADARSRTGSYYGRIRDQRNRMQRHGYFICDMSFGSVNYQQALRTFVGPINKRMNPEEYKDKYNLVNLQG